MLHILTLSIHLFIAVYIYRKCCVAKKNWDSNLTIFCLLIYFLILNLYWVGDLDDLDWWECFVYKFIWIIFLIIYTFNFFIAFNVLRNGCFIRWGTPYFWLMYSMRIQNISIKFWTKGIKKLNSNNIEKEWYTYQTKYNKKVKSRFITFLYLFGIILILLKFLLIIFIIIYCIFITHTPLTPVVVIIEKNFVNIFFLILKLFILYKIIFSIFLTNTSLYWIFFFYSPNFEYTFTDYYKYLASIDSDLRVQGLDTSAYITNGVYTASRIDGDRSKNRLNKNLDALFNEWGPPRFRTPKQWRRVNYKVIGKFVNTKYFNFWLYFQRMAIHINHPKYIFFWFLEKSKTEFFKNIFKKLLWGVSIKGKPIKFYTFDNDKKFEKNLKKYKYK